MSKYSSKVSSKLLKKGRDDDKSISEKSILEILKQYGTTTSIKGIPSVFRSEFLLQKIFWITCFLTCLGLVCYELTKSITAYLNYDVLTKNLIVNDFNSEFPSIVFCNQNPFNGFYDKKQIQDILTKNNVSSDTIDSLEKEMKIANLFESSFAIIKATTPETAFGFYLDEMLIGCSFQGKKCTIDDFDSFYDYNYGNCYRFNGGKNGPIRKSKQSKYSAGLSLELFVGEPNYQQQFTYKSGIRLIVHNQSSVPSPDDDGIDIATGQETNVAIGRTFIKRESYPYGNCFGDVPAEDIFKYSDSIIKMFNMYNQTKYYEKYCLKVCLQEIIFNECKCYDLKLPIPAILGDEGSLFERGCHRPEDFECIKTKENEYYASRIEKCLEQCPKACEQVLYVTNTNFASYPSLWYSKILNKNQNFKALFTKDPTNIPDNYTVPFSTIQRTCLRVNVYYGQMYYNLIEESPKTTFESLIVSIAGNLALFLGVNVLTAPEFPELIFFMVYNLIGRFFMKYY